MQKISEKDKKHITEDMKYIEYVQDVIENIFDTIDPKKLSPQELEKKIQRINKNINIQKKKIKQMREKWITHNISYINSIDNKLNDIIENLYKYNLKSSKQVLDEGITVQKESMDSLDRSEKILNSILNNIL